MQALILQATEPARWTVVFHRRAENRIFSAIAMGHFKHVSAFAWLPEVRVWLIYDVGFRRTRITVLPDTAASKQKMVDLIRGNAIVTMPVRFDAMPVLRLGLFCTTAVKHLIGLSGVATRPDALYRLCLRHGGELSDDIAKGESANAGPDHSPADRSQSRGRAAAGQQPADIDAANAGAG